MTWTIFVVSSDVATSSLRDKLALHFHDYQESSSSTAGQDKKLEAKEKGDKAKGDKPKELKEKVKEKSKEKLKDAKESKEKPKEAAEGTKEKAKEDVPWRAQVLEPSSLSLGTSAGHSKPRPLNAFAGAMDKRLGFKVDWPPNPCYVTKAGPHADSKVGALRWKEAVGPKWCRCCHGLHHVTMSLYDAWHGVP